MATMRAAFARGPGKLVVEETERPTPGAGDVILRIGACGICGSDLHWYHDQMMIPQVCPGHEIAGTVAMAGSGVTSLKEGDRVSVEGIASCGECRHCITGNYHFCTRIGIVGMTIPGGYAEYLKIPARHCFAVVDMDFATAALSEPLGVAVHGVRISGLEIGQRVLVLGAGTIGLMAIVAARAGGAGEILVTARRPQQKKAALALGADRVFDDTDEGALMAFAADNPVDLVVESVGGSATTLDTAVATCRPGGSICLLGVYTKAVAFPAIFTVIKELTIKGSFVYNRTASRADFDVVVDLLRRHGDRLGSTMVTHRYPLAKVDEAFKTAADKTSGSIKVSITGS
ncbi:MAG TPA: alcohol dehydrogenase catalytic domain-containing protein [Candidatus Eisenbacteria bacterium]|nr:alcohol dehydrogenase catalytic domain-containing protein [Candidatus Eisenbacteria bacterium]